MYKHLEKNINSNTVLKEYCSTLEQTISNDTNWETTFEDLDLDDKDKFTVLEHDITGFKGHTRYDIDGDNRVAKITNIKIVALPNTGGVGITLLVIVTIGLLVGAYVVHRRSEH